MKKIALLSLSVSVFGQGAYAQYYYPNYQQPVYQQPAAAVEPDHKIAENEAELRGDYKHIYRAKDNSKSSTYAKTEDGAIRPVKFSETVGFVSTDSRSPFTIESTKELVALYTKWVDGPTPPDEATKKSIKTSLSKVPAIITELERVPAPSNKLMRNANGDVYARANDGTFVTVTLGEKGKISYSVAKDKLPSAVPGHALAYFLKPLENYPQLYTTKTGGLFGEMHNERIIAVELSDKGVLKTTLSERATESYIAYLRAKLEGEELADTEKASAEAFLASDVPDRFNLTPVEGFDGLFAAPNGKKYGILSDGSRRILIPHTEKMIVANDAPEGTTIPDTTIDAYIAWFKTRIESGSVNESQKNAARKLLLHHALANGESSFEYEKEFLYRAGASGTYRYFIANYGVGSKDDGIFEEVKLVISDKDGEFTRRGQKIAYKKGQWLIEIPSMGQYRIHQVKELTENDAPKGFSKTEIDMALDNHTEEERYALRLINTHRANNGLGPLALVSSLRPYAHRNSELQCQQGGAGHPAGNTTYGLAEIATLAHDAPSAVNMWQNSGNHNSLMLGGFSRAGVAVHRNIHTAWTVVLQ